MKVSCTKEGILVCLTPEEKRTLIDCDNTAGHPDVVGGVETVLSQVLTRRPKPMPPICRSCNSEMTLAIDGKHWTCQFCQGEQGPIKVEES